MSNFVGNKPNPLSMLIKGAQKVFGKTQKTTGTGAISSVNIAKNLAKKKSLQTISRNFDEGFHIGFLTKVLKVFTMGCPKGFHDGVAQGFSVVPAYVCSCVRA